MNIFILDVNLKKSAIYHVDKHCVKMILEHAQMLCTSLIINENLRNQLNVEIVPYKKSHMSHPCTIWVSSNYDNFAWLVAYTHELHEEYKYRYNKEHLSYKTLLAHNIITKELITHGNKLTITELNPPTVMPEECQSTSVVDSYRNYYKQYKHELFKWTKRDIPDWI
ncbi:MAG: pyrimidine dimer DNA glycosylase/endonuclease V [Burkholderiales bacterium]|nr:pyrimidine dimer DNA glycosylase/endonuclease V [Burkholderiales bacterium]